MPTTTFLNELGTGNLSTTGDVTIMDGTFAGAEIAAGTSLSSGVASSFNFDSSFTVACWIKASNTISGLIDAVRFAEEPSGDGKFRLHCDYGAGDNNWVVYDSLQNNIFVNLLSPWVLDTWNLCVCYYDSVNGVIGYSLNGAAATTAVIANPIADVPAGSLTVADPNNEGDLTCSMLAFWSRVLTAAEITALYNGGTFPIKYPF